jgi:hypothetical protein
LGGVVKTDWEKKSVVILDFDECESVDPEVDLRTGGGGAGGSGDEGLVENGDPKKAFVLLAVVGVLTGDECGEGTEAREETSENVDDSDDVVLMGERWERGEDGGGCIRCASILACRRSGEIGESVIVDAYEAAVDSRDSGGDQVDDWAQVVVVVARQRSARRRRGHCSTFNCGQKTLRI